MGRHGWEPLPARATTFRDLPTEFLLAARYNASSKQRVSAMTDDPVIESEPVSLNDNDQIDICVTAEHLRHHAGRHQSRQMTT